MVETNLNLTNVSTQPSKIPDAEEVVIELDWPIQWDLFDEKYGRHYRNKNDARYPEFQRNMSKYLEYASLRINTALTGTVVERGYKGGLTLKTIYDTNSSSEVGFTVKSTQPEGVVKIVESTNVILQERSPQG